MKKTNKKLRRIPERGILGGVCAGIAYYFGIPVWIIRAVWALIIFWMGFGLLLYPILWIFMPKIEAPSDYSEVTE